MYPVEKKELFIPPLDDVCTALETGLLENFSEASVTVENSPNFSDLPWSLASEGICGKPHLLDVGGVPYLTPTVQKDKIYNFEDLAKCLPHEKSFFLGAGAGPWHKIGTNSEMMANLIVGEEDDHNVLTRLSFFDPNGDVVLNITKEKEFCLLGNFLASEGLQGKVLKVTAKHRIGKLNFVENLSKALQKGFPEEMIGMGGVFLIRTGKANIHVMPSFSTVPLQTDADVDKWLKYFEVNSPLVCLSVFYNIDKGMDLRMNHTHCFNYQGEGGHYHFDTTPEDVEYEGYFVLAEKCVRVDRPVATHQIGRD